jgi:hypothetical protein
MQQRKGQNLAADVEINERHSKLGCTLTFASEAKFEIEAKILFSWEAKKKPDFT